MPSERRLSSEKQKNGFPPPGEHVNTAEDYRTVHGEDCSYVEDDGEYESEFDFSDLTGEHGGKKRPKKRLPFSPVNLPDIFRTSFKEVFGIGMIIRVFLAAWGFWATLSWVGWGSVWKVGVILCVLLCALLYRYYFQYSWGRLPVANFVGTLLFSVALSYLCTATTHQTHVDILFTSTRYGPPSRYESDVFSHLSVIIFILLYLLWGRPQNWFIWKYLSNIWKAYYGVRL